MHPIQDQNINLHAEWDNIPTDIGDAATRELLAAARAVPASPGRPDDWPAAWATDTVMVAHEAFAELTFTFNPPQPPSTRTQWLVAFEDHTAYLWLMDQVKRKQLAKGGAELSLKVGDGGNREGGISWGCLTPPLLHQRSDMPCPTITSSS
ncbi:hypothetical protein [Bradyrhizobium sp. Ash2021]|uniref:hypothetical protein n=1 Tax=Bradyrhizobium sp. Ash2021 TaxID=2954771 RepID=UPI0028155C78|nr:hypothetical protein [Bradyrhizobium sp. Ash2021]WMT71223.1 hypothetical protein NL528_24315 [Bradyrhizobium sp. Ash2021]